MDDWKIVCCDNDYPEKLLADMREADAAIIKALGIPPTFETGFSVSYNCFRSGWIDIAEKIPAFKLELMKNQMHFSCNDALERLKNELNRV